MQPCMLQRASTQPRPEAIQRSKPTHALQRQEAHEHELPNSHVLRPMARLHIGGTRRFATSRYLAVKAGKDYRDPTGGPKG